MKYASKKELYAIFAIVAIFLVLGISNGHKLIESLKPLFNLPKIAFAGFLSFAFVGIIMAIGNKFGIWFGKRGGAILYSIVLIIVGLIVF
jgi:hypothetical protein